VVQSHLAGACRRVQVARLREVQALVENDTWKRKDGGISMSHGDMAVTLKGIYAP